MYNPFAKQRRISLWAAIAFFVLIFPYGIIGDTEVGALQIPFCVLLNLLSSALFGFLLYKMLIHYFPVEQFRLFGWLLGILAFCHLVFTGINPGGWVCIGVSAVIGCIMLGVYWKSSKQEEQ